MIIPAGTVLHYQKYSPLEVLAQELHLKFWSRPPSLSIVQGMYFPHHHQEKHLYHFESGTEAVNWLKEQHIEVREKVTERHEAYAFADALAALVEAADKIQANKTAIRSIAHAIAPFGHQNPSEFISYITLYAALYK